MGKPARANDANIGWSIRVPGSTSNLGPGFDCLGLCVSMFLDVRAFPAHDGPTVVRREGEPVEVAGDDLLVAAFDRGRELAGAPPLAVVLEARSTIPFGRGFGSSGAAVAAGLLLGVASTGEDVPDDALHRAGLALEGHPDNVVASLHGGATLGVPLSDAEGGGLDLITPAVHPDVHVAAAWPAAPLPTPEARRALPATVPFADAVENPRRLALLLEGLRTASPALLAHGGVDHLHERHRGPLIPGAEEALAAARGAGAWSSHLSGAGSGLVALCSECVVEAVAEALAAPLGPGARSAALTVERRRPAVRRAGCSPNRSET